MTVKELIEALSKMPQDAVVEVPDWYSDTCIAAEVVGEDESEYYGKVVNIMP